MVSTGGRALWGIFLLCLVLAAAAGASQVRIAWEALPPLALPRHSGAAVVVDERIYLIGGIEYGNTMTVYGQTYDVTTGTLVDVYDLDTGSWESLAPLPYPIDMMKRCAEGRQWTAAAAHEGKIYVFGGANLNGDARDTIDVYDIASDTWTAGAAHLPEPIVGLSAATVGDTIYLFGGSRGADVFTPQDYLPTCYTFDPITHRVTAVAPMPISRFKTSAVAHEDGVLVLGGISARASVGVQWYDITSNSWTSMEPVYWERRFWDAAAIDGAMFLVGGREHGESARAVDVHVPDIDAWLTGDPMCVGREDAFVVAVEGALYVFGGRTHEGTALVDAERGIPDLTNVSYAPPAEEAPDVPIDWSYGTPMPTPRYFGATAVIDKRIYTIGGLEADDPTGTLVEAYDPAADSWTRKASLPEGRFNVSAAVLDGTIYVFGGADITGQVTDTVYAYDPAENTWSLFARLPKSAAGLSAATLEDRIYLFGGSRSSQMFVPSEYYSDDVYAFDPATVTFESLPPMPIARNMAFAGAVGGNLFVVGGMRSPGETANQRYSPTVRRWEIRAEMPHPRGGHTGVVITTLPTAGIFVLGGANQVDVYGYSANEDRWHRATSLPAPRNMSFAAVVALSPERIYVIGGADETGTIVDTVLIGEPAGGASPLAMHQRGEEDTEGR